MANNSPEVPLQDDDASKAAALSLSSLPSESVRAIGGWLLKYRNDLGLMCDN